MHFILNFTAYILSTYRPVKLASGDPIILYYIYYINKNRL